MQRSHTSVYNIKDLTFPKKTKVSRQDSQLLGYKNVETRIGDRSKIVNMPVLGFDNKTKPIRTMDKETLKANNALVMYKLMKCQVIT
jgi:hypothetical protein